ncbi:WD40/YVTN/BNR-like repeat-containing protein [Thiohalorhabdus sp.]|uniref:WD40/YVTN/BNR-like repeat-containing protein n=1 Tax=Thiohalorhabdus sp. TaxID=3094134 RepID=UPI002FC2A07D
MGYWLRLNSGFFINGVEYSTDGTTWEPGNLPPNQGGTDASIKNLDFSPGLQSFVVFSVESEDDVSKKYVFLTTDGLEYTGPLDQNFEDWKWPNDGIIHGGQPGLVIGDGSDDLFFVVSTDGQTLNLASVEGPAGFPEWPHAEYDPTAVTWMMIAVQTGSGVFLWQSTDGGATWAAKQHTDDVPGYVYNDVFVVSDGNGYFVAMWFSYGVSPSASVSLVSSDGGATWDGIHESPFDDDPLDLRNLGYDADKGVFLAYVYRDTDLYDLWYTPDGISWTKEKEGGADAMYEEWRLRVKNNKVTGDFAYGDFGPNLFWMATIGVEEVT